MTGKEKEIYIARRLVEHIDQATPYYWTQPTLKKRLARRSVEFKAYRTSWAVMTVCIIVIVGLVARHV